MSKLPGGVIDRIRFFVRAGFSTREVERILGLSHGVIVKYSKGARFDPEPDPQRVAEAREALRRIELVESITVRNPKGLSTLASSRQTSHEATVQAKPSPAPSPPPAPKKRIIRSDLDYAEYLLEVFREYKAKILQNPVAWEHPKETRSLFDDERYMERILEMLRRKAQQRNPYS